MLDINSQQQHYTAEWTSSMTLFYFFESTSRLMKENLLPTIAIRTQTDCNQFKWHLQWSANNVCIYTDKLTTCCSRSQLVCATETRLMSLTRVFLLDSEIGDWTQLCAKWFCWHSESNKNVRFQRFRNSHTNSDVVAAECWFNWKMIWPLDSLDFK